MGKWIDLAKEIELRDRGDNVVSLDALRRRRSEDKQKVVDRRLADGGDHDHAA